MFDIVYDARNTEYVYKRRGVSCMMFVRAATDGCTNGLSPPTSVSNQNCLGHRLWWQSREHSGPQYERLSSGFLKVPTSGRFVSTSLWNVDKMRVRCW